MKIIKTKNYLTKIALPVYQPSLESKSLMEQEGIRLLHDINPFLPNTKKRELKNLLLEIGIEGLSLPKIFYPQDKNVVTYKNKEYYYLHHEKPKGKNVGKLWLLDLQTGEPIELPYEGTVEQLNLTDSERREQVRNTANKAIGEWNSKIDKLDKNVGLVTIPLRVQRVLKLVDQRLIDLNGQKKAIESQSEYGTKGSEQWKTESLEALKSGKLNDQDAIDTALFWYQEKPEELLNDLSTFNISEKVKQVLINIVNIEIANKTKEIEKKKETWEARENRMEGELPEIKEPFVSPVSEFEPGTLPGGSVQKPNAYRSFESRKFQQPQKIKEIDFQIKVIENVREALQKINSQIAGMQKGQFTEEYLMSPKGGEILSNMKFLLDAAYGFIKKYSESIFTEEGKVNPKLFGSTGNIGNVELAVEMNRLYNAVRKAVQSRPKIYPKPETVPGEVPQIASSELKIIGGKFVKEIKTASYVKLSQNFEGENFDSLTIEPIEGRTGDVEYKVVGHGIYERGSVLSGQPRRAVLDFFETVEEALRAYPQAEVLEHSTKTFGETGDPGPIAPFRVDPADAGERWDSDY